MQELLYKKINQIGINGVINLGGIWTVGQCWSGLFKCPKLDQTFSCVMCRCFLYNNVRALYQFMFVNNTLYTKTE